MDEYFDYDRLRDDLIIFFGTAVYYNPMAQADLVYVSSCGNDELINVANSNNFDLSKYIRGKSHEKD